MLVKGPAKERKIAGVEVLSGKGAWRERLLGTTMTVSAPSFFQVNTRAAESLVSLALESLAADGSDRVLDLFAGAGTFTLPLAEKAGEVIAVESASSAVRDLRRNLEDEGLWADVIGGDAGRELPAIGRVDLALVDPPRSGLQPEAVEALAQTARPSDRLRLVRPCDARARRRRAWPSGATRSRGRRPSTCSRRRTTSRPSRCSNARPSTVHRQRSGAAAHVRDHAVPRHRSAARRTTGRRFCMQLLRRLRPDGRPR